MEGSSVSFNTCPLNLSSMVSRYLLFTVPILLSSRFQIFIGSGSKADASASDKDHNTAIDIVKGLIDQADLTSIHGWILYTDNWYTSIKLAKDYHWRFCGTLALTNKKSRIGLDVPFVELSKGVLRLVDQGWFREAVVKQTTKTEKKV